MIGTPPGEKVLSIKISVFRFGEVVVVVKVVVVVVGQRYSGQGHPLGQPDSHRHFKCHIY